jgi:hypothetical protein
MKKSVRKLQLHRDTIQTLADPRQHRAVRGGGPTEYGTGQTSMECFIPTHCECVSGCLSCTACC